MPVRRWISRCERRPTCFIRLISAHCSTPSNTLSPVSINRSSQIKGPVGRLRPHAAVDHFYSGAGGPVFRRRLHFKRSRSGSGFTHAPARARRKRRVATDVGAFAFERREIYVLSRLSRHTVWAWIDDRSRGSIPALTNTNGCLSSAATWVRRERG